MGQGDQLIGSGMARGAKARGKRIAFGDGRRILWDRHSAEIFRGNPNVAQPGSEMADDLEWVPFYKGHRIYNRIQDNRWVWNREFRATPGEIFLNRKEQAWAAGIGSGFILIEPNVEDFKGWAPNKRWPYERYDEVAACLGREGFEVVQLDHGGRHRIPTARQVKSPNFRHGLAALKPSALYIGPEGGMHHGAAAVGVPGVVIFGGFIPPRVTGYATHTNLTGGAEACGSLTSCRHCRDALRAISASIVFEASMIMLRNP
ncbi:MAG: glycosyltransferase family 9 protein [Mesorhizobium sp.]|nr:MAG: glycosyltransferase family 9 protein [Mesorhizobium sp.]